MSFLGLGEVADWAGDLLGRVTGSKAANEYSKYANENALQIRVKDGLAAGINPLAAIGASTNYAPTLQTNSASDLVNLGDGAVSAVKGMAGLFKKKAKDDIAYDNEAKSLDLESKRLENRILRNRVAESELNLTKGSGKEVPSEQPNRVGDVPLFSIAYDLQGRPRLVANQDVVEGDADNPGYLASVKHAITQGFVDPQTGKVISEQYKMMLDDMYYNMYGRHISNLDDLYFSPAEAGFAAHAVIRGVS